MSRKEFIEQLRRSLSSINDYTFVNDTISYYENYIESQLRMGKSEEEVMQELGDPRLIAKSIRATHIEKEQDADFQTGYQEFEKKVSGNRRGHTLLHFNGRQIMLPSWLIKLLAVLILVGVLYLVFTILSWLAPFIFFGVISYMIYKMITGGRGRF